MFKKKFPVFATLVLIFSLTWLFEELNILKINLPWLPIILIILAIGWIFNRFSK